MFVANKRHACPLQVFCEEENYFYSEKWKQLLVVSEEIEGLGAAELGNLTILGQTTRTCGESWGRGSRRMNEWVSDCRKSRETKVYLYPSLDKYIFLS